MVDLGTSLQRIMASPVCPQKVGSMYLTVMKGARQFLTSHQRDINKGEADIAGEQVNSGANILCMFPLYGKNVYAECSQYALDTLVVCI